jgi:hypothetical protein
VNKDQLKKNIGYHVRLRPKARHSDGLSQRDDDWLIQSADNAGLQIKHIGSDQQTLLPYDHIREFLTDPNRNFGGIKHGFLRLKVQLTLTGNQGVKSEPSWD